MLKSLLAFLLTRNYRIYSRIPIIWATVYNWKHKQDKLDNILGGCFEHSIVFCFSCHKNKEWMLLCWARSQFHNRFYEGQKTTIQWIALSGFRTIVPWSHPYFKLCSIPEGKPEYGLIFFNIDFTFWFRCRTVLMNQSDYQNNFNLYN